MPLIAIGLVLPTIGQMGVPYCRWIESGMLMEAWTEPVYILCTASGSLGSKSRRQYIIAFMTGSEKVYHKAGWFCLPSTKCMIRQVSVGNRSAVEFNSRKGAPLIKRLLDIALNGILRSSVPIYVIYSG